MAFGSYRITTTTPTKSTKYTQAEIKEARSQVGPNGTTEQLGAQIQQNRATATASTTAQQKAAQKEKNSKTSVGASAARAAANAGATQEGTSKRSFWEKAAGTITGAANTANDAAGAAGEALGKFDKYAIIATRNFVTQSQGLSDGINQASSNIAGGIAGASAAIEGTIQGWKAEMNEALKPVSTAIGSTAMMVENVARNPLGAPQLLAQGAVALLDKVSPQLASQIEGASKSINLENLANLPGQMMGSIRNLTMAADALLSVPFTIVSDIYNGLMDIMEEIANLIDSVVSAVFDLFFGPGGLLDSIIPISEILSMLEAIGELASFVGDIASLAGGFSMVTNITGQITGAVSNISSALQNPLQFVPGIDQVTGGISQVTSALRNPEQFLPAGIGQQMQKISSIPGLGFVANCGTSIGGTLDSLSQGVFTKALDKYAKQAPMLAPLMGQQSPEPSAINNQEACSDDWKKSEFRPEQSTANNGLPALNDTTPWKIFDQGSPQQNKGPISAYGMTEYPDGTVTMQGQQYVPGRKTAYGITEDLDGTIAGNIQGIDLSKPYGFSLNQ